MQYYVDICKKKAFEVRTIVVWAIILFLWSTSIVTKATSSEKNLYYYPQYKDSAHRANYLEHWYFNFQTKDIKAVITYEVYPAAKTNDICGVRAILFTNKDNKVSKFYKTFSKQHFKAKKYQISIGTCKIILNEKFIKIVGKLNDEVLWNLEYLTKKDNFYLFKDEQVGLFKWERYSSLVYGDAKVVGTVKISGRELKISGSGYCEHRFGFLLLGLSVLNHLQVSAAKVQLVFAQINSILKEKAKLTLLYNNRILNFPSVKVKNLRILIEEENLKEVIKFLIQAENNDYYVELVVERINSSPIRIKNPQIGPDLIIFETYAKVDGKLTYKGDVLQELSGRGFYESTVRDWLASIKHLLPGKNFW